MLDHRRHEVSVSGNVKLTCEYDRAGDVVDYMYFHFLGKQTVDIGNISLPGARPDKLSAILKRWMGALDSMWIGRKHGRSEPGHGSFSDVFQHKVDSWMRSHERYPSLCTFWDLENLDSGDSSGIGAMRFGKELAFAYSGPEYYGRAVRMGSLEAIKGEKRKDLATGMINSIKLNPAFYGLELEASRSQ